ncbi:tRNA pseudouridine(13) synthase TruD, partial [Candidatus Bathyarchaeota archaeon]|nr:tRNA pseudouridine(13) synthase TruD [Candidatus Bathyarchaeota archaeon]
MKNIEPPEIDKRVGMLVYVTRSPPVSGRIREKVEDFEVEEVTDLKIVERRMERGYAVYLMEKRRMDTFTAVRRAARLLGVSVKDVRYAGLKDTVAVTRQYITVPADRLSEVKENLDDGRVSLRLVGYSNRRLRPGALRGNRFKIAVSLRDKGELKKFIDALKELSELSGIPGFYGYQRFGVRRPNTHVVGRFIVKRMWDAAVREIAGNPYPWEPPLSYEARRLFEEGKLKEALEKYPRSLFYERLVVRKLLEGYSSLEVLKRLPRSLRLLYVSGYQSYLFNLALSRRLMETKLDPTAIMEGDIVRGAKDSSMVRRGLSVIYMVAPGVGVRFERLRGRPGELIREVMAEEDVKPEEFRVEELGIKCKAVFREVFMKFTELKLTVQLGSKTAFSFISTHCWDVQPII